MGGSRCALRARADSHRGRRGCPVFQEPVLGAVDGERRNNSGVLGVLFEVPQAPMTRTSEHLLSLATLIE